MSFSDDSQEDDDLAQLQVPSFRASPIRKQPTNYSQV